MNVPTPIHRIVMASRRTPTVCILAVLLFYCFRDYDKLETRPTP